MKVILQENIDSLGYVGDVLDVADGYARNYLLPRQKALKANPRNVKALEHAKRVTTHKARKIEHELEGLATKLSVVSLTFPVRTGKDDKLFGAITAKDLEAGLAAEGFDVDRRKIQLANPLKELGTFSVGVKLHRDIVPNISVSLVKQGEEAGIELGDPRSSLSSTSLIGDRGQASETSADAQVEETAAGDAVPPAETPDAQDE